MSAPDRGDSLTLLDQPRMRRTVTLSADGAYRYDLGRYWDDGPTATWIMLNPSTADDQIDDPTIRRCIAFTKSWGLDGMTVVNLYALRSSDPKALLTADDPIGPRNVEFIERHLSAAVFAVAAWGAWDGIAGRARPSIADIAQFYDVPLTCLGTTKAGHPRHPLYVKGDTPLVEWPQPGTNGSSPVQP